MAKQRGDQSTVDMEWHDLGDQTEVVDLNVFGQDRRYRGNKGPMDSKKSTRMQCAMDREGLSETPERAQYRRRRPRATP